MRSALAMVAISVLFIGCGGTRSPMSSSTALPVALSGTWAGSLSDSTGSMMGAGLTASMMRNASWKITQTDSSFTGEVRFMGYSGGPMHIRGTIDGKSGTITMTLPAGSMMMNACSATADGKFDMDDALEAMHGTYAGSNTCNGSFTQGQFNLVRQ